MTAQDESRALTAASRLLSGNRLLVKVNEIQRETGMSKATVYKLLQAGRLKAVRRNGGLFITAKSYRRWLEGDPGVPAPASK